MNTLEKVQIQKAESKVREGFFRRYWPALVLAAFWLFNLAFVGVSGNFPLNDDWIYAESVEHLLKSGQLRLLACAPACIFHILAGAAVCNFTGFSYEVLRLVGFAWAIAASFFMYGASRELRVSKSMSAFLTLCFSANPIFLCLAFSFMTDTPAIALTLAYLFFLLKGIRTDNRLFYLASALSLIAGTCVRQNLGLMAVINVCIFAVFALRKKFSPTFFVGLVILPAVTAYAADKWMLSTNDFNSLYVWYKGMASAQIAHMIHAPSRLIPPLIQIAGEICAYLGLFFLPVLALFLPTIANLFSGRRDAGINPAWPTVSAAAIVFSFCKFILAENRWMPFNQNILRIPAVGAHTILGINHAALSMKWKQALTWVSAFAGFVFMTLMLDCLYRTVLLLWRQTFGTRSFPKGFRFALSAASVFLLFLFQFAFTSLQSTFSDLDRYYLFPGLAAILALGLSLKYHRVVGKKMMLIAMPLFLLLFAYSTSATQDMMSWNRARWQAISALEQQGVPYEKIEGGAEYNYARDPMLFKNLILHETFYELTHRGEAPRDQWRWWSVHEEDYIISFSPVPGYDIVARNKYWSALAGEREILTLKKISS